MNQMKEMPTDDEKLSKIKCKLFASFSSHLI